MTTSHPPNPVNLDPIPPLLDSYVYHSQLPVPSKEDQSDTDGWIMGIDEAGRGPVLGPMVYAAAYCPVSFKSTLEGIGFDDSKALNAETRQSLWDAFQVHDQLCYSSHTLSPQSISLNMLRRVPVNLNRQAEDATIGLIRAALDRGVNVKECYVDALGPSPQWQAKLSAIFPTISFTVCPKADSLFKIVGAASIIAKVTRDRYIEHWVDPEEPESSSSSTKRKRASVEEDGVDDHDENEKEHVQVQAPSSRGSGYPSDPRTQAFLKESTDNIFGYRGIVRFSWATVKVLLDKQAAECKWIDDVGGADQPSAASYSRADADNDRPKMWRDLGVSGVGEL